MSTKTEALMEGLEAYCPKRCRESDARCFGFPTLTLCDGIPARDAIYEAEKLDGKLHEEYPA